MADKPGPDELKRKAIDDSADELARRATDDPTDDTEGHSLSLLLGMGALERAREQDRNRQKVKEEELPPLAKPFPSMKDDTRK